MLLNCVVQLMMMFINCSPIVFAAVYGYLPYLWLDVKKTKKHFIYSATFINEVISSVLQIIMSAVK